MTFFEFIKSLIDSARDRAKTPIVGAYTFSFIAFNWKAILFLIFSHASIEDKLVVIKYEYTTIWSVLAPLIMAIVYMYFINEVMLHFDKKTLKAKKLRRETHYDYQVEDLTGLGRVLQQQYNNEIIRSGKRGQEALNNEIEKLKAEIDALQDAAKSKIINTDNGYLTIFKGKDDQILRTELDDIMYIKAEDHYLHVYSKDGRSNFMRGKLSEILSELPPNFVKCHRSYIVNTNYINSINAGFLVLKNNTELPISRGFKL